jgi:glyoxylase-like metal-dependent hydrolase (beta-lactamase superfamily II)
MHGFRWHQTMIGVGVGVLLTLPEAVTARVEPAPLRLEQVVADSDAAFHVVATIVVGRTESVLWDGQYRLADGRRLADRIAATGTRLKAIVISHADHDHYMGAQAVLDRFPGTPVYMAASTLADFGARSAHDLEAERKRPNHDAPERLVTPQPLPQAPLTVDGRRLEVLTDFAGDVPRPASSILWIPSLRAALAADLVFSGVHPWLGESDIASRAAWRASLERLAALKPAIVVPGHKVDPAAADSPDQIAFMRTYLDDFDASMQAVSTPLALVTAMREKYPLLRIPALMAGGARRFRQ